MKFQNLELKLSGLDKSHVLPDFVIVRAFWRINVCSHCCVRSSLWCMSLRTPPDLHSRPPSASSPSSWDKIRLLCETGVWRKKSPLSANLHQEQTMQTGGKYRTTCAKFIGITSTIASDSCPPNAPITRVADSSIFNTTHLTEVCHTPAKFTKNFSKTSVWILANTEVDVCSTYALISW